MEIININEDKQGYALVENKENPTENIVEKNGKPLICPYKTIIPLPNVNRLTGQQQGVFLKVHSCGDSCMHFHKSNTIVTLSCGNGFKFEVK